MLFPIIYRIGIFGMHLLMRVGAIFNQKLSAAVAGRRQWKEKLAKQTAEKLDPQKPRVWMHAASLGEFEQGKPVIEKLKLENPDLQVIVSFFSPSGYEPGTRYRGADLVCYLPFDSPANAGEFLRIINPGLVIWVKYEYWWFFLHAIRNRSIPLLLVSAIFQPRQMFFKWYGRGYRRVLHCFDHLFVQEQASAQLLCSWIDKKNITVAGDTRFDRVIAIAQKWQPVPGIEAWVRGRKLLVAGSTWEDDEKILLELQEQNPLYCLIIVPHKVDKASIQKCLDVFPEALTYSRLQQSPAAAIPSTDVLIIDTIGFLSRLYYYADIAYIGGGFNKTGIHNCLEAAVYAKPLMWGPEYSRYAEAISLVKIGAAGAFSNPFEANRILQNLTENPETLRDAGNKAGDYVKNNGGATETITSYIHRKRLLTNA